MATDSTNLPLGETNVDAGTDMTGNELDLTAVQLAQVEGAQPIELPKGNQVILIPVKPGQVIELPTDSTDGLLAKIGPAPEGNLAIVVDGRTIILQGYVHANEQSPVKLVTNDGDTVDVADVVAATDPTLDIQTAAGPATNPGDTSPDSSGIFIPFGPGADLGGLHAAGILDPTALQYKLIDDDRKEFNLEEDTGPSSINITFDILGGVINEDDLQGAQIIDLPENEFAAKLVVQKGGNDGVGNDPFDDDGDVNDKAGGTPNDGVPDSDLEPLVTVATVKVNFNGDVPGKLVIDDSVLPSGLTSDGQPIVYDVVPVLGHGNGIVGFIDNGGTPGEFDKGTDRLVFTVLVDEPASNSEFHVIFTLYDNIDNTPPDENGDGAADLLGANEQTLDLPVKITAIDSDGTPLSTVMHLGVTDDIPFFGQAVDVGEGERSIVITPGDANITHDESWFPQPDADDQSIFDPTASSAAFDAGQKVHDAGFSFPYGDSVGSLFGIAQSQVLASFGADQASTEFYDKKDSDPTARNSIFGELEDRTDADGDGLNDGENEHPFELFMIANGSGPDANPTEDNLKTPGNEGNLTIEDQPTNATVTWNGDQILQVFLHQIDAHTIVGYVIPEGEEAPAVRESMVPELDNGQEAVFVLTIDDNGVMTFVQYHQINHDVDGPTHQDHDDPFQILGEDGTPIIQVRISDHDGDHATQPVNLVIQDDGPHFIKTFWGFDGDSTNPFNGTGLIDEDKLPNGNFGGPGDDKGGTHADGKVFFNFGVDQPGHLAVQGLQIKDSAGNIVVTVAADGSFDGISSLHTADGRGVEIQISGPDGNGVVTWQAVVAAGETGEGDPVFTLTLDTAGADLGEFDFDLHQALDHPFQDSDSKNDGPESSFEDNLNFDFTVRGFDVDGDWADGHIKLSVDDDSPDACKVDIRIDDGDGGDGLLVQDETSGVQNGGNNSGDKDPNASGQDEDDVSPAPTDFPAFEAAKSLLSNLGYAATKITVDLSGGTLDADAAIGADVPGTVSPVSIVGAGGVPLNGAATNLFDTQTGERIYLFTETVGGETFVVGHVGNTTDIGGNALGPISFALHTTEGGDLELGQYRAIQHPDTSDLDESVTLLADNNQQPIVYLQVTVTDADGDSVVVNRPLGGEGEKGSAIVFQDDGPTIHCTQNSISLAVDESVGGDGTDLNTPFPEGVLDGPAIENDEDLVPLPTALTGLGTAIGAATAHGGDLFTFNAGVDGEKSHSYSLTIGGLGATGLHDTAKGQPITLTDAGIIDGQQVVEGKNTDGDIIFAISIDPATGEVSVAQYLAIDHGGEENEDGGAHDELVSLGYGSLSITLSVTDGDNDTVTKSHDISGAVTFDDDAPDVTLGSGTLSLQMDESISLSSKDVDDPSQPNDGIHDGSAVEGDVLLNVGPLLASGLAFLGFPIGAASGNVGGLFNVDYGSDGPGTTAYALHITSLGGATDLVDTATQTTVTLSLVSGHIEGRDGFGNLVFAVAIDPNTGDIVTAQYRAIDHGDEEGTPGAFDEVKFLTDGSLAVVATVTDKDGDFDTISRDISHGISFDDDGPKFIKTFWGFDGDSTTPINGIGLIDEDALPHGKSGGPGDDAGGVSTDGQIVFDFGSDQPGSLKIDSLKVTNSLGNSIALADLHTADGQPLIIDQSAPDGNGVVSLIAYVDLGGGKHGDKVFEFDIDTKGSDIGEFQFTLFKPLEHPFTDSDSQNNGPDTAFEDNLNFDFTIIGTDGDGDSDTGHIKIKIDDDSPVAVNDTDSVTEGKGNIATGNVVTAVDGSFVGFGPDANGTDGSKDAPGADEPYTISKLSHDGHDYTLSANGLTVLKDGAPLVGPEGFDGKVLTITTHEGATFQIVLISSTLSEVGSYKYTAGDPPHHDVNTFAGPADTAESRSAAFDTLGEWQSSFAAAGITVSGINGAVVVKDINVAGPDDYRGLGVSNANGDEPEVDLSGPDESMQLDFASLTNNAKLTLGALFDGAQFDGGNQEIVLWQVFNGAVLVASGQILGSDNGLVTLDIDTGGSLFNKIVLTPLDNGAGSTAANNSDFLLLNVETCKQADDLKESFTYTLEDADGDKSTATLAINVVDTQPTIPVQTSGGLSILVDEDGLNPSGTIKDGIGDHNTNDAEEDHTGPNAINDDAKHIGTIPFVAGADPVTIELSVDNKGDTGLNTLTGKNIFAAWDPEEQQLVGYVEGTDPSDAANRIFIMHIDGQSPGAFNYTFTLLQPIQHADGGPDNDTENNPDPYFNIGIQIEDKDCDVAYTTLKVTIDDDMPVVQVVADAAGATQHDETAGKDNNVNDDDQSGAVPALFNVAGLPPVASAIGWARDGDSVVNISGSKYGADGPGTTAYALVIPAAGTDSGVLTTDGHHIWLYQGPNNTIVGREGDATLNPNPAGAIIFAVSIDSGGALTLVQYDSLQHPTFPNEYDEDIGLNTSALQVKVTLTDADGDSASGTADIGNLVRFDDDGPKAKMDDLPVNVQHDETAGVQNPGDGDMDQNPALLPANLVAVGTLIGWAKSDSAVVTTAASSYGADDEGGTTVLSLKVSSTGVDSGLDITTGEGIFLYKEGDVVVGRVGSGIGGNTPDAAGAVAFVVSIDQDGKLNLAQYLSIHHNNTASVDETAQISDSAMQVVVTVTDGDGDVATDSHNIGSHVRFDDDGPTAVNDVDSVTEGKGNVATGNVVTAVDGSFAGFGPDANGTDGNKDDPGADKPYTISKLSHDGHDYTLSADGLTVLKDNNPLVGPEGFDGKTLTITTHEGATFQIVLISSTLSEVGSYKYTAGDPPHHDVNTFAGPADTAESRSAAFDTLGEWQSSFAAAGITVSGINGTVVVKDINVAGPDDYRGLGVSNATGDEPEVDLSGPDESLQLDFAALTNNAKLTLGALFDGNQFDAGSQEIVLWQVFNGAVLVASGEILGSNNGLVTLDIDTGGSQFNKIVLTPVDNGAGSTAANNSDFLLLNVETCKQANDLKETFGYTLQDGDGDKSTATLTINVADTQPSIPVQTSGGLSILVDEDGLNPAGTAKDGIGDHLTGDAEEDHTGPNAATDNAQFIGTIPFVAGADPVTIDMSVDNKGDTGLDTLTGKNVMAAWDPEEQRLVGYVEGSNPADPANQVFVLQITGQSAGAFNYTFTLLQPIHHADTDQLGDDTENSPDPFFNIGIQIEDKDCDVAYTTLKVTIDDDMPVAKADIDSVTEDAAKDYASGNVVTGIDGGLATDSNGTDGVADAGGADGIKAHSVQWSDAADKGGIDANGSIVGKYGTLSVDDSGNYKYVLDETNPTVNALNDGDKLQESFTYFVKDNDDDKTSSTLTITIDGHTDAFPPEARDATATVDEDGIPVIGNHDSAPGDDNADLPPDTATPDEHIFHATLPVGWNGNPGTITLAPGDLSALRTIDNHTINVTGSGTGLLQGIDSVTSQVVFTVQILNATTGEYQVTLSKPLLHPDSDNNHANDSVDFGLDGFEDNLTIPVNVTYTNIGGTVTKALSIDVDDDMPFVAPTTCGTISLAVDETLGGVGDDPHNPGFTPENDETLFPLLPAQLTGLGTLIGAAQDSAAGLFTSSAGADGEFDHSYELTVTNGGATGLTDTATGLAINLVKVGDVVQGQVGVGPNIAFAFYIDEATGQVSMAQYRAIVHTDPTNPDDVRAMIGNQGVLGVTLTVTDNDGDKASLTRDISGAVSFDDDGPKANDDPVNATPGVTGTADVVFIVDVSGSMTNGGGSIVIPGVPDFSDDRLGLARFSMRELLTNHPEILNVQFIKFDDNLSSPSSVWMTRADALTYIANDANFVGGGATNYDVALQEAINIYGASARPAGAADQTVVYFLSDGAPNTANDPGGDAGITNNGTGSDVSIAEWETFVSNPANNITNVFAIGLGSANVDNLEPIAYPNDDVNPNDGTEDRVVIIPDSNITALTQTLDDLLTDVITPVSGNVTDNDNPGTDGFGNTELVEVVYGITHYVFDATHHAYDIDLGVGRGSLHIDEHGAYTYTPPSGDVVDGTPFSLQYVIRDGDNDTSIANILIDLNSKPLTDLNGVAGGDDVTVGFTEQTPTLISPAGTISDDGATLASMTVTLTNRPDGNAAESLSLNGAAAAAAAGLTVLYTPATGVLTITGSASTATYQTILQGILYNNTSDAPNTADRAVNVVVNDGVSDSVVNVSTITVTPVNDAPDAVAPVGPYSATEQTNLALHGTGLSISDIDAGGGSMTVTLSVGFGTLNLTAGNSGASIGAGNGTSSVQVTGTVTQINNLLGGIDTGPGSAGTIVYNANSDNPPANTTLTLHVNDNGNTGGGSLTDDAFVTINIAPVNDAPNTNAGSGSGSEDAAKIAVALSGTDPDGTVGSFKITSLPTNGKLYADLALTNEITLNETVTAAANAATVYFVPDHDFHGSPTFQYAAIDNNALQDASPATATITVSSVDDPTVAVANHIYTNTTSSVTVEAAWLLHDDSDPDGPLTVTSVDESSAKFAINDGGLPNTFTLDFTDGQPNGSSDPFTYTLSTGTLVSGGAAHLDTSGAIDGSTTNDILVGNGSDSTLNGNNGNDVLFGGGGNDALNGGGGDDWLIYDTADGSVDGGTGFDVLRFESVFDVNVDDDTTGGSNEFAIRINNIEAIDMRNGSTNDELGNGSGDNALSATDVIDMTDAGKTLYIMGDGNGAAAGADDQVRLSGTWTVGATAVVNDPAHADINGHTFTQYTNGGATLFIQNTIDVDNNSGG